MRTLRFTDGRTVAWPCGKVVCVGRNYAAHARELANPVPERPLLFLKPTSAIVELGAPLQLPTGLGPCHHELELALLIGERATVAGLGLALDLTLRDVQTELKRAGHPWARAKAFRGACPLSAFVAWSARVPGELSIELTLDEQRRQTGRVDQMLHAPATLLAEMDAAFGLDPGDVVLTGTPAGVGPLRRGQRLTARLLAGTGEALLAVSTVVA